MPSASIRIAAPGGWPEGKGGEADTSKLVTLFLLKLALPPLLVAAVSLVARRWGPTVGGMLVGLPWMTGPVLYFLALDKGVDFAVGACTGIELGIVCVALFMLAYAATSAVARWPVCVAAGAAAFAAGAFAMRGIGLELPVAAVVAALSLVVTYALLPAPRAAARTAALPWWDIPARMLSTLVLIAAILLTADLLGPRLSGIVSTYPTMVTVVSAFTHHQWGRDALLRLLRGLCLSLLVFIVFFLVVGLSMPAIGVAASFAIAVVLALAIHSIALVWMRQGSRV
jgi:hypothetical protein